MNTDLTVGKPWKVLLKYILPLLGSAVFPATLHVGGYRHRGEIRGEIRACGDRRIDGDRQYPDGDRARRERRLRGACLPLFRGKGKTPKSNHPSIRGLIRFRGVQRPAHDGGAPPPGAPILRALKTPSNVLDASVVYLNIYYMGLPFLILYNLGTGIFSALGDSRTPLLFSRVFVCDQRDIGLFHGAAVGDRGASRGRRSSRRARRVF